MKEKNYNLQVIRIISFILVVVIHVTNYFCRAYGEIGNGEYLFSLILDTAARVSVPGFFMLSGALLLGRKETMKKSWQRVLRFLPPLVFWSIAYYLFNVYYMGTEFDLKEILWTPAEAHLWYLYAMIPLYLVLPFLQVMLGSMNRELDRALVILGAADAVVMYLFSVLGGEPYYDIPVFGDRIYAYYFILGYYLMKYRNSIRISNRILWIIFIASNVFNVGVTFAVTAVTGEHMERTLEYGFPLIMVSSASFFLLMLRAGNGEIRFREQTKRVIDSLCACSFGIYLIHIMFLDNYKKHLEAEAVSAWIAVPGLTAVILLASFGCVLLIRRLPGGKMIT